MRRAVRSPGAASKPTWPRECTCHQRVNLMLSFFGRARRLHRAGPPSLQWMPTKAQAPYPTLAQARDYHRLRHGRSSSGSRRSQQNADGYNNYRRMLCGSPGAGSGTRAARLLLGRPHAPLVGGQLLVLVPRLCSAHAQTSGARASRSVREKAALWTRETHVTRRRRAPRTDERRRSDTVLIGAALLSALAGLASLARNGVAPMRRKVDVRRVVVHRLRVASAVGVSGQREPSERLSLASARTGSGARAHARAHLGQVVLSRQLPPALPLRVRRVAGERVGACQLRGAARRTGANSPRAHGSHARTAGGTTLRRYASHLRWPRHHDGRGAARRAERNWRGRRAARRDTHREHRRGAVRRWGEGADGSACARRLQWHAAPHLHPHPHPHPSHAATALAAAPRPSRGHGAARRPPRECARFSAPAGARARRARERNICPFFRVWSN